MKVLELRSLTSDQIPSALELDQRVLGGIWTWDGYQREIDSPNSDLLVIKQESEGKPSLVIGFDVASTMSSAESSAQPNGHSSFVKDSEQKTKNTKPEDKGQQTKDKGQSLLQNPKSKIQNSFPYSPILALGCSWAIVEEAHITLLAVDPQYQQQGLGQAMLWALLAAAHQRQLERATLEVRVANEAALALYTKFGFKAAGRRKRYYQDTGEDALVLWRGGLHHPTFPQELEEWQEQVGERLRSAGWELNLQFEGVGSRE